MTYGGSLTLFGDAVTDSVSLGRGQQRVPGVFFGATYNVSQPQRKRGWRPLLGSRQRALRQDFSQYPEGIWCVRALLRCGRFHWFGCRGLAFQGINELGTAPLLDTVVRAQRGWRNVFALCVRGVGGAMRIGDVPNNWGVWCVLWWPRLLSDAGTGWRFTPVTSANGFWQPTFAGVFVNGALIPCKQTARHS